MPINDTAASGGKVRGLPPLPATTPTQAQSGSQSASGASASGASASGASGSGASGSGGSGSGGARDATTGAAAMSEAEMIARLPRNAREAVQDNRLTRAEWPMFELLLKQNVIHPAEFGYFMTLREHDQKTLDAYSKRVLPRFIEEVNRSTTIYGRALARDLKSGKVNLAVKGTTADYESNKLWTGRPSWESASKTINIPLDIPWNTDDMRDVDSESIRIAIDDAARVYAKDEIERPRALNPESNASVVAESRDLLESSDAGKRIASQIWDRQSKISFADYKSFQIVMSQQTYSEFKTDHDRYVYWNAKAKRAVVNEEAGNPKELVGRLVYAQALVEVNGDHAKAQTLTDKRLPAIIPKKNYKQMLDEAFTLLEQTDTGKSIAAALKRDNVNIELADKKLKINTGEAGGVYYPRKKTIKINMEYHNSADSLAAVLAHEGAHHVYYKKHGLIGDLKERIVGGAIGLVKSPFELKNPLSATVESAHRANLETERYAHGVEDQVRHEIGIGIGAPLTSEVIDREILNAEGSIYQLPTVQRLGAAAAFGVGGSLLIPVAVDKVLKRMGRSPLRGRPTRMGLGITTALVAQDFLDKGLKAGSDERNAYNVARVGLGVTASAAVLHKFAPRLMPISPKWGLAATGVVMGANYLREKFL